LNTKSLLSLLPAGLVAEQVTVTPDLVSVFARGETAAAQCPVCNNPSRRVHSRYRRRVGDLPWLGTASPARTGSDPSALCVN